MPGMGGRALLARVTVGAALAGGAGLVAAGAHGVAGLDGRLQAAGEQQRLVRDVTRGHECGPRHHVRPRPAAPQRDAGL